jgi:hypothetical protein
MGCQNSGEGNRRSQPRRQSEAPQESVGTAWPGSRRRASGSI